MRRECLLVALFGVIALPLRVEAQLGAIEAFARRVSDLSFYFNTGGLVGSGSVLERGAGSIRAFGVELLFEVAEVERPLEGRVPARADSVRRVWTGMEVVRSGEAVDTVYTYEIERLPPPAPPTESIWVMEMGIGYGQLQGYQLEDPSLDLKMAVRDLPAVSLYASYEPWGNYFGIRTGFMRTQALQVADEEGTNFNGQAEAFLFGVLAGYAFALEDLWFFVETGFTLRHFPSVEWRGASTLPSGIPRELDLSAWSMGMGLQFPFN